MKHIISVLFLAFSITRVVAQSGGVVVSATNPDPLAGGSPGTGTITLTLTAPWAASSDVINLSTGPGYNITSLTGPNLDPGTVDYSNPNDVVGFLDGNFAPGVYVFNFTIMPTGTVADPVGVTPVAQIGTLPASIGPDITLPVTLVSFNVAPEGKTALLSWKTTEETNSDYFEVQHSLNAKDWEAVGKVKSHNEGKAEHDYVFTFAGKKNGRNYFRLNMVDLDGTASKSIIRSVNFDGLEEDAISFGPNPTSDYFTINAIDWSTVKSVNLLDKTGRKVYSSGQAVENTISVRNLSSGLYVLQLTRKNGEVNTKKILVTR